MRTTRANRRSVYTMFRPRVRSRHPSHSILRHSQNNLPALPFRSRIRLGSTTEIIDRHPVVELNSIDAIRNSSSKLRMKQCFRRDGVKTADWYQFEGNDFYYIDVTSGERRTINVDTLPFPIVCKKHFGSRNNGNTLVRDLTEFMQWREGKNLNEFIFEKYYSYNREYRLHVNSEGCFYTCRKMLKSDAPEEVRWYRNDEHCVWIMEDNPSFDKPVNWDAIVEECVKALHAVGLDFGAVDLRVQSARQSNGNVRQQPEFIVVEINSAPSFGDVTGQVYIREIPEMLKRKKEQTN